MLAVDFKDNFGWCRHTHELLDRGDPRLHLFEPVFEHKLHTLLASKETDVRTRSPCDNEFFNLLCDNKQFVDTNAPAVSCVSTGITPLSFVESDFSLLEKCAARAAAQ